MIHPDPTRPLDVARVDLAHRAAAADEAGHWQERAILVHLADVADYTCRIGDHDHSAHYRADKSGELVSSALGVELECMRAYADAADDDDDDPTNLRLDAAKDVTQEVARAVRLVMWTLARQRNGSGAEIYFSDASTIRDAIAALHRWAEPICAGAVPDPVDE